MGKLQPDYITWTLSVNADGLQKEMLKVRNNTKELKAENVRLKSSMENLAMQGKLQSKEYKELNAQLKANNRTISENGEKLRLLESRLNNADKSYAQLSKQARQLRRELDNTVKSLQPQEYARLEAELAKTKEAMEQLRPKAEAVKESFFSLTRMKSAVVGFFAGIGASAGSFFSNSISEARSWMSEGIRLAANADGVRRAFDKLDRPGMLSELRKATKDTVNDLELMQAAVRAKDFRIPLEDLGKYLQFARLKAQQTGQSVDYLTDSIITGLGRKSLLILDNLGLSAAEVNEEMAKTGDLMAAVAAIVDRQLAQAGENYVSAADKAAQKAAELQNRQMEIGRLLLPLQEKWSGLFQSLKLGFSDVALWVLEHKKSIITLISVVTGFILVYKTVILLQKTWNGLLMLGKAVSLAYASVVAMQRGNILRSAAAMKMYNASVASNNILVKACTASTYLFAAAKAVLTGNINKARIAMQAFYAITKISPLAIVATVVAALTYKLVSYRRELTATEKAERSLHRVRAQAADTVATETRELNTLLGIARNEKISKEQRMEAIKRLNALSEEYLGGLRLETINTREATAAVKDYTDNLLSMARIRSANSRLEEIQKEKRALEEQRKDIHANRNLWDSFKRKYSINSLVYWVTYVHNVVYSFYRSMIYCYINSTQRCAGSIVIDIIPTNGADKRKFFPFAPYFPVTNVIKRYFYPYFPAIIGIKGYSFPYFPYLSGIMKIKTALYSLFSRLDWHKTVVFPCLGEIYEGIRSLSWEIPVT
ncbi:hypothetical protein R3O74_015625 [Bacteroides hominis]